MINQFLNVLNIILREGHFHTDYSFSFGPRRKYPKRRL